MSQSSQFSLLSQRRFGPFFWTQFFGALNDNLFKTALLVVLSYDALSWTTLDPSLLTNLIPGLFILPYVLVSATSGQLADKLEKSGMVRAIKWLELVIMGIAMYGWVTHHLALMITALVGMGIHSTLFGPVKYAYLPQHLKTEELVGGNGLIEMGTFVGILAGQILASVLIVMKSGPLLVGIGTIVMALLGLLASYRVPPTPAADPALRVSWNFLGESIRNINFSRKNRTVFLSLLGNSWFWFYGAIILAQFPVYAKDFLHGEVNVFTLLLTVFSFGIGMGSLLCERLSGHKVEIGLVPFGSIGMSVFGIDLYCSSMSYVNTATVGVLGLLTQTGVPHILIDIFLIGLFGGFFIVPLFALIQTRSDPKHLSRTIAGMNILNALFMVAASGFALLLLNLGLTIPQLFLATGILNAFVALYIFLLVPEFLLRFLAWIIIHTIHRVHIVDSARIPETGPAVLVCNHVSYVDVLVILAASPRPIRFVMDNAIFKTPLMGWLFRAGKAIPIAPAHVDPVLLERAYDEIERVLADGELVCIFPEGKLTRTGEMNPFKGGVLRILERSNVPVIPMALSGLWGHLLSRADIFERAFHTRWRSRLSLAVGLPLAPQDVSTDALFQQVSALRGEVK